jgi:hypothetical protein
VASNVTSTTYKAYAKASNISAFSDKVAVRFLNGALDLPLSSIAVGSTTTLQGTLIYQTPLSANSQPVPLTTFKQLLQDQDNNLLLNSAPSDVSLARFSVYQNSNQPTLLLNDRANLGAPPATTDIMQVRRNNIPIFNIRQNGDVRITGNILDTNSNASWIPGSTVEWKTASAPTINFPTGVGFAYSTSNATYRYVGNEVTYNFNITGVVSGTAVTLSDNYTLNLTYPLKTSSYPTETMVGSIMMGVYTSTGSNTYACFAKTLPTMPTPADTYKVNLRYLNGTYERSLTDIQATSVLKLQGQLMYTTPLIANNVQLPTQYTQAIFTQDQTGNVIFNGGGNAPVGTFEIRSTSNAPALIVNQTTSSNTSSLLELKQNNVKKIVVDAQGNVGIGTGLPLRSLDLSGETDSLILPTGTYNQRPDSNILGQVRFNTFYNSFEQYDGSKWTGKQISMLPPNDNMMLFWDAGNTLSYPGTGTTLSSLTYPQINGTISGATYSSGALTFNGTTDYVDATLNNPAGAWVHSISIWLQISSPQSGLSAQPFQIGTTGNTVDKYSAFYITNGLVSWYFFNNDTQALIGNILNTNTWYHFAFTYAGGAANITNKRIYMNGISLPLTQSSGGTNPLNIDANAIMSLGRDRNRAGYYFPGKIANFQIFNRVLTPVEVTNMYHVMKPRFDIPIWYTPGSIIQVLHAVTATTRIAITSADITGASGLITGLEIYITPKFSTSKILLTAMINHNGTHVSTFGFLKNDAVILTNTNLNASGSISTVYYGNTTTGVDYMYNTFIQFVDTITSTSTIKYHVGASASWNGATYTTYINDRNSNDMRSISNFTIYEIAG